MKWLKALAGKRAVRRTLGILAGLLLLWTVAGFLVLPPIVRRVAVKEASKALGRKVEIAQVRLNPYALSVTVRGLRVNERAGADAFFSFDEVYVRAAWNSLFKLAPVITEVRVAKPYLHIVREEGGRFNFSDLVENQPAKEPPAKPASKPFRFSINNIQVTDGEIALEDKAQHKSHRLSDIQLTVPSISNFPNFIETGVQPAFSAALDGSLIRLTGTSKPFARSLETRVVLDVRDIDLPHYLEYAPMTLPFQVPSGKLTVRVELAYLQSLERAPMVTLWGDVSLSQFQLNDAAGVMVLSLPDFRIVGFSAHPFVKRFYCRQILLGKPELSVTRDAQGRINLLSLLPAGGPQAPAPAPKPEKESTPSTVEVAQIEIAAAKVTFTDLANRRPFTTVLSPIDLELRDFSVSRGKETAYQFGLATESGETISLDGAFSLAPMAVHGGLRVEGLVLGKYAPYYEDRVLFDVESGRLDLGCRYSATMSSAEPDVQLSDVGVALKSLQLRRREEKAPFLTLPVVALRGGSLDLAKLQLALDEVSVENLSVQVAQFKDGEMNLQKLVPPAPKPGPAPAAKTVPWQATVRRFEMKDCAVRLRDEVPPTPVAVAVEQIGVKAENLTTAAGAQMSFDVGFRLDVGGSFATKGTFTLQPPAAKLRCDVKQLNLAAFQPYAPDSVPLVLGSGLLSFGGDAAFASPATGTEATFKGDLALEKFAAVDKRAGKGLIQWDALRLGGIEAGYAPQKTAFKGDLAIEKFAVIDKRTEEKLVQWDALRLSGIEAGYAPLKLSVAEISLDKPAAHVVIGADGASNIATVFVSPEAGPPAATAPKPPAQAAAPQPNVTVGRIALHGGQFTFLDRSIAPAYSVALAAVDGKVEGLSLDPNQTAQFALSASLDNTAPLLMTGKLRPAKENPLVDLHVDFRGIELSPVTPYSDKYLGYPVTRGKLTLGLDYLIQGPKLDLDSKNRVFLDQFTLGDRVESPTATHAPIKLALALLRNRRGEIQLDLPVSGSLNDPKFRVLPVLVHVLLNIVEKAATSPFSLVASLVGGGEEMSYVEFDYGSAALDAVALKKLDGIVKLLEDRPALRLELQPQLDPQRDTEVLRKQFMDRKLRIQKLRDTATKGETTASISEVKIEPQEYEKYLGLAYEAEDIPDKPRNALGIAKWVPPKQMEELLLAHTTVARDDLRLLAYKRAANIRDTLLASKAIEPDRLFIAEPREGTTSAGGEGAKPRTQFALGLGGEGAPPPAEKAFEPPPVTAQSSDTVAVKPRSSWGRRLLIGAGVGGAVILVVVLVVH